MQKSQLIKIIVACVVLIVAAVLILKTLGVFSGSSTTIGPHGEPVKAPNMSIPSK